MSSLTIRSLAVATVAAAATAAPAFAWVETFDNPVTLSNTQAAGAWYTDRYAPAGFTAPVFFDGDDRLQQSISAADGASSRPGAYSSSFYNTQGRKYDLDSGVTTMSIDLFVGSDWGSTGRRMAGFWGTAFDGSNNVGGYPILEFTSDGGVGRFRAWDVDTGNWLDLGLPTGFGYGQWYTLGISLSGGMATYTVGDLSLSVNAATSVSLSNVILQGYNTQAGVSYDIYWDNLTSPVPAPGALALLGMAGLAGSRRRRA